MKKLILILCISITSATLPCINANAFTRVANLVNDGEDVSPEDLQTLLQENRGKKKKKRRNRGLQTILGVQANPTNIEIEVDNSGIVQKTAMDVQSPISSFGFFNAIQDAVDLWESVDIADIDFAPLKFTNAVVNSEDGRNVITARADAGIDSLVTEGNSVTILTIANTRQVQFNGETIMTREGTILDGDIIYDPGNDMCLVLVTTTGDFRLGGEEISDIGIAEGGADSVDATISCMNDLSGGDITDEAVQGIGKILGLDSSAIFSSATANGATTMSRWGLTTDDRIGLANIYPKKSALTNHGTIRGNVTLEKQGLIGAHVYLEDPVTGEPITGTITDLNGNYEISAIPVGTYDVFVEPLDGAIRNNGFFHNFFAENGQLNFTTTSTTGVSIRKNKKTKVNIKATPFPQNAFNIVPQVFAPQTLDQVIELGGNTIGPVVLDPGEVSSEEIYWGINLDDRFGTLTVSGTGVNVLSIENISAPISPLVVCAECEDPENPEDPPCNRDPRCPATDEITSEPDEFPGFRVTFSVDADATPGPRSIIFTADEIESDDPNSSLRDQVVGGIVIRDPSEG